MTRLMRALEAARAGALDELRAMLDGDLVKARFGDDDPALAGMTLLHAVTELSVEAVQAVLDAGAEIEAETAFGMTAVACAAFAGNRATAERLAERGAGLEDDIAIALGRVADLGPEPNLRSGFLYACKLGSVEGALWALDAGVDVNVQVPGSDWGGIGATGLHWAVHHGHPELARALLDRGADLALTDDPFGATPLEWADEAGHPDIAALLRDHAPTRRGVEQKLDEG